MSGFLQSLGFVGSLIAAAHCLGLPFILAGVAKYSYAVLVLGVFAENAGVTPSRRRTDRRVKGRVLRPSMSKKRGPYG